jgi:hypothetical protein
MKNIPCQQWNVKEQYMEKFQITGSVHAKNKILKPVFFFVALFSMHFYTTGW